MRIFVIGCPHDVGGAGPHCWHTARLWRKYGLEVVFVPVSPVETVWRDRLLSIGCEINYHIIGNDANHIRHVQGLPGGITIAFCNGGFLELAPQLRVLGCKTVWLGCMNWLHEAETRHYERWGPFDRYVFQSYYQQHALTGQLERYGYQKPRMARIPSPICVDEYEYNPIGHTTGESFCVGRISRPDTKKFTQNLWDLYGGIRTNIRARVMGWDKEVEEYVGKPPLWAECLPKGAEPVADFMSKIHCMIQVGRAKENRPRTCLEAMACGVPVVAPNDSGWKELIRHGHNGFLCNNPDEISYYACLLANDEPYRLEMAARARAELDNIANPDAIWACWQQLFEALQNE